MPVNARTGRAVWCRLALVAGLLPVLAGPGSAQTTAPADAPPPAVTVVRVASQDVTPSTTYTGRIEAIDRVDLRARVEGVLEKQNFVEGSEVKTGDLLFVIEKAPYQAAVDQVEGDVVATSGKLKLTELERDRQQALVKKQAAAQARLDEATAGLTETRGALMRNQASLAAAKIDLGYTEITSPIDGKIGRSAFSVGNLVGPSSGVLATIVSQDPMYVTFPVTVRDLLRLRKSTAENERRPDRVTFDLQLADGSVYPEQGRVDFANVLVDQGTDTVLIRGKIGNPDRMLIDGALVGVVVHVSAPVASLVIPQNALQLDQGGPFVLLVDADDKIQVQRVVLKQRLGSLAVVQEGLKEGDRVVTEGLQKVRPGVVVTPSEVPMPQSGPVAAGG